MIRYTVSVRDPRSGEVYTVVNGETFATREDAESALATIMLDADQGLLTDAERAAFVREVTP